MNLFYAFLLNFRITRDGVEDRRKGRSGRPRLTEK